MTAWLTTNNVELMIANEDLEKCFEILCNLNFESEYKRCSDMRGNDEQPNIFCNYCDLDWDYHQRFTKVQHIFNALGFETTHNDNEDLILVNFDHSFNPIQLFLDALSEYWKFPNKDVSFKRFPFVEWKDDDGHLLTVTYSNRGPEYWVGQIVWDHYTTKWNYDEGLDQLEGCDY